MEKPQTPAHITLDISTLYRTTGTAKLSDIQAYEQSVLEQIPAGAVVTLTGPGPVWLYLRIAHRLHGRVTTLYYDSPVTGSVEIFDHNPR